MPRRPPILAFLCLLISVETAVAENWPGWRGPRGDGTSRETTIPREWDAESGSNIRWTADVPGDGYASPIVWDDAIFLVSCLTETQERVLLRLDRDTGHTVWQQTVLTAPLETKHRLNSYASGTPATDGELIYVAFQQVDGRTIPAPNVSNERPVTPGRIVVAAYDFDGRRQWRQDVGEFISAHGFCSCPVLYGDLVIVNGDHDGDSYIAALDKQTGGEVWRVSREHGIRSYVTPIIREYRGRTQMVLSGSQHIASYNPLDGAMLWKIDGPTEQFVASMIDDGRRLYIAAGFPTYHVMAIDPTGRGNVTDTNVLWHRTEAHCYVPSPVVVDGYVFVANDDGIAHCFDAETGTHVWRTRLGRHYSASLVTAAGLVYFLSDEGITSVVRPGPSPDVIAENYLDEFCAASPAVSQGMLLIRGKERLYCIVE